MGEIVDYTKFDEVTGRILSFGTMQDEVFRVKSNVIEGQYDDSLYYIVDYYPETRPLFSPDKLTITADGVDETVVTGLPIPFIVDIDGEEYTVDDGSFEFSTTFPGTYKITPRTFPYRQQTIEVTAV